MESPAHLHLLLNHLPIIGLLIAALSLLLAVLMRNRGAQIISLILIILTSAAAWPTYATGQNAYIGIRGIADERGVDWLDTHMERADRAVLLFAIPPIIGLLAIFLPRAFPRTALALSLAVLLACAVCLGAAAWIADAGGKIRHPELRYP